MMVPALKEGQFMRKTTRYIPALLAAICLVLIPAMSARASFLPGDLISIKQENEMGRNFDRIIRSKMGIVGDTYITDYINDIVTKVVQAKKPMPFTITSTVIASPIMNAFAIPGGYIYTFTGLIQGVESESQLAGVIAHELAHVSQRHVAKRIEKMKAMNLLAMAGMLAGVFLGMATGKDGAKAGTALMLGTQSAGIASVLGYTRENEREADHIGLNSLVKAGYNPEGMAETFQILLKNKWFDSGSNMPTYLSTHPGLTDRTAYLNDRIQRMPPLFTTRSDDNTKLLKVQALVRSKMSPAETALAHYNEKMLLEGLTAIDYMAMGIVQERLKRSSDARISFKKAMEMDSKEPLIDREYGIFCFKTGDHATAFKYLQKAFIKNRRDALALFYLARIQAESKDYDRAANNMQQVLELVPGDQEVYHHLGMIQGKSGDTFHGNLNLGFAQFYSGNAKKARFYYNLAKKAARPDDLKQEAELDDLMELLQPGWKKKKEDEKKAKEKQATS